MAQPRGMKRQIDNSEDWSCSTCTTLHSDKESSFLACRLCGATRSCSGARIGEEAVYAHASGTAEIVRVIKVHSASEGGGYTISIPSLQRERQTVSDRLNFDAGAIEACRLDNEINASFDEQTEDRYGEVEGEEGCKDEVGEDIEEDEEDDEEEEAEEQSKEDRLGSASAKFVFILVHDKEPQDSGSDYNYSSSLPATQDSVIVGVYSTQERAEKKARDYTKENFDIYDHDLYGIQWQGEGWYRPEDCDANECNDRVHIIRKKLDS